VARKTANVVLGNSFKTNVGFVVDTHVHRLSQRLGLVSWNTPVPKAEKIIMACFADFQSEWCDLSHRLIFHGRGPCKARGGPGGVCSGHAICQELGQKCELRVKGKPAPT
jgi:endonuclease-3